MDNIQDASARIVGGKVDLLPPGWGGGRPATPTPLGYGLSIALLKVCKWLQTSLVFTYADAVEML